MTKTMASLKNSDLKKKKKKNNNLVHFSGTLI